MKQFIVGMALAAGLWLATRPLTATAADRGEEQGQRYDSRQKQTGRTSTSRMEDARGGVRGGERGVSGKEKQQAGAKGITTSGGATPQAASGTGGITVYSAGPAKRASPPAKTPGAPAPKREGPPSLYVIPTGADTAIAVTNTADVSTVGSSAPALTSAAAVVADAAPATNRAPAAAP